MLGHGCFGYRQFFMYVTKIAGGTLGKKLKYRNACWMPHCFGKAGKLFLGVIYFIRHIITFVVRKSTNIS